MVRLWSVFDSSVSSWCNSSYRMIKIWRSKIAANCDKLPPLNQTEEASHPEKPRVVCFHVCTCFQCDTNKGRKSSPSLTVCHIYTCFLFVKSSCQAFHDVTTNIIHPTKGARSERILLNLKRVRIYFRGLVVVIG